MRDAVRVALLARPGAGGDRLREAIRAAGANLVLDADPTTLQPDALAGAGAQSVVVLLDAAVEEALDRLDPVLHDPAIDVLYEESEVAAAREGWDVARWTRHLSAKLMRHGDVLPPGREADGGKALHQGPAPSPPAPSPLAPAESPAIAVFDPVSAEYDPGELALPVQEADPAAGVEAAEASPDPDWSSLTLDTDDDAPPMEALADAAPNDPAPPTPLPSAIAEDASAPRSDAIRDFRRDLAGIEQRIASMELVDVDPPAATHGAPDVHEAPTELAAPAAPAEPPPTPAPTAAPAAGAVLVFAGIGGPDAVRQFLGALPAGFPRPVLIHQRLDGGRYDRLVQQMARATSLPVELAADAEPVAAGHVYILPPGLGLGVEPEGLRFLAGGDPMATLPPGESAVLMFSGSDTALVDAAMDHARAGALVAGQSPEDCYDAAAADALVARGAESGQPADLARRLAERWAA